MTNESSKGQNTSAEETLRQRSFIRTCAGTDGARNPILLTSIDILPDNIWMSDE